MKKSPLAAAALALIGTAAQAQTGPSVSLSGVVDVALRASNAQGPQGKDTLKSVSSGGMAPSRLVVNVSEDLGGGLTALANMDHRFQADTGAQDPGPFWQQSWVGLQSSSWGRVTLGRQYNVLFDVAATTFAPFLPIGPFMNAYKPEVAMALGTRNDNQLKYALSTGPFTMALQASPSEGKFDTTTGRSLGGTLRYSFGSLAVGAGYLERQDTAERKAKATLIGAGYTAGPWYLNAAWARDHFDDGLNTALLMVGSGVENTVAPARPGQSPLHVEQRDMWTFGGTYQLAPQWRVGAQLWSMKQRFYTPGAPDGSGRFAALVADYTLSKRTDLYATIERTSLSDLQLTDSGAAVPTPNGATARTSLMAGMRHRF